MPTVLVPFKEFPGASHSAQSSVTLGTIYCWQSLECVFYPGSVRKEKMEKGYVQVTVSTTAERPWPWLFLVRSLPSKQPQETLCLPINSCSAHKQSENMSDCHELDKTCIALCVLILTFVILLRFYNTSNNPPNNKILQYQMEIKTPASQSVSTLSYVHCLDFSTACLQTAWPSSEELLKIKFRTETYQGSLKTQPRDSSISLEFEVFFIFFWGGGAYPKARSRFLVVLPNQRIILSPSETVSSVSHQTRDTSNVTEVSSLEELGCPVHLSSRHFVFLIYAPGCKRSRQFWKAFSQPYETGFWNHLFLLPPDTQQS